ncbi:hypothetical protein [Microterricola viridarii]|uniref:Uncharacterized protein n=1 Tax=Microterricola viridarii TaxID=412690 RepID=A0A1H1TH11_9MICO|nr:hypothetical protein [Microterricola viridarii]SDS59464.1 hypothetical protein SAMN04489834_1765 [Microterricola viridarii]
MAHNSTSTLIRPPATPLGVSVAGLEFLPVRGGLWRVASVRGTILGQIELCSQDAGAEPRFTARALHSDGVRHSTLGDFGTAVAAADCFR